MEESTFSGHPDLTKTKDKVWVRDYTMEPDLEKWLSQQDQLPTRYGEDMQSSCVIMLMEPQMLTDADNTPQEVTVGLTLTETLAEKK